MGYEVDFLAVGDETKGGDAITLRYGNLHGSRSEQTVVVIDGGYKANGAKLVELIRDRYGTERVDIVVSTHPDQDHISGLEVVLSELEVGALWMHQPWKHSVSVSKMRESGFPVTAGVSEKLSKSLQEVSELETIAVARGVPIVEPFAGIASSDGGVRIVGPSLEYYDSLLPEMVTAAAFGQSSVLGEMFAKAKERVISFLAETLHIETLNDDGVTRASNNSSAICLVTIDDRKLLFTGDAGIPALENVADFLEAEGFAPGDLCFVQVPHHGSRRNVGPTVLNRLLGEVGCDNTHATAFVSSPAKNPNAKHPSKKVTNAFRRRGYAVHATQGTNKWHHRDAPGRLDYSTSEPLPFHDEVEDDSTES